MIRLRSLFWKLFFAFFIAMHLWLFCGMAYMRYSENPSNTAIAKVEAFMLLRETNTWPEKGLQAALATMKIWNTAHPEVQLSLLDTQGNLLHGGAPVAGGSQKPIILDGNPYLVATNVVADSNPSDTLPIQVPLVTSVIVGLALSGLLAWYLSYPLQRLRDASHAVASGDFSTRVLPALGKRQDEMVDLAKDFDHMASHLQTLIETRQHLFHDISHELRSPLARMNAALGLLRQNPSRTDDMLQRIEKEVLRMNALVEEVLTLARLEAGLPFAAREEMDVVALLTASAEDASFEAEHAHRTVSFQSCSPFIRSVNGEILCRAFDNVLRNALHYTPEGKGIYVSAIQTNGILEIMVEDEGTGVSPQEYESIFDVFRRSENSAQGSQGFGLGLAIARHAITFHDGEISAKPSAYGGLCIVIRLPDGSTTESI